MISRSYPLHEATEVTLCMMLTGFVVVYNRSARLRLSRN